MRRDRIEGSRGSLTLGFTCDAVGQQDVVNTAGDVEGDGGEEEGFRIPEKLTERQQMLLKATADERAPEVVRVLKSLYNHRTRTRSPNWLSTSRRQQH